MTNNTTQDRMPSAPSAARTIWAWLFLALWALWLGAMIWMSLHEWGRPKLRPVIEETPRFQERSIDSNERGQR